jgi:uncharacterized membrane protein HdeD (DUF308 family)
MINFLQRSWWALVLRGLLAILFGVMAISWPSITLEILILFFGAYSLVDGFFSSAGALAHRKHDKTWWLFFLSGLAGIVIGALVFLLPGLTALVLVYLIAARALLVGILEITAAIYLRREVNNEWFMILNGLISILFAVVLFLMPGAGALALVLMIGIVAIIIGILLLTLGFRLRSWNKKAQPTA